MKLKIPKVLIELKPSQITPEGVGVFAVRNITKGTKIAGGPREKDFIKKNIIPWQELKTYDKETQKKIKDFCIGTPNGFLTSKYLDLNELSTSWYMNHSCNGNVGFDKNGDYITIRNIKRGEEISFDYGLLESNPKFIILNCTCGSNNCRGKISGNDWKNKKNKKLNHPYLKSKIEPRLKRKLRKPTRKSTKKFTPYTA